MEFLPNLQFCFMSFLLAFRTLTTISVYQQFESQLFQQPYAYQQKPYSHRHELIMGYRHQPYMNQQPAVMGVQQKEMDPLQRDLREQLNWMKTLADDKNIPPLEIWEPNSPQQVQAIIQTQAHLPVQQHAMLGVLPRIMPSNQQFKQALLLPRANQKNHSLLVNSQASDNLSLIQSETSSELSRAGIGIQNPESNDNKSEEKESQPDAEEKPPITEESQEKAKENQPDSEGNQTEGNQQLSDEKQPELEENGEEKEENEEEGSGEEGSGEEGSGEEKEESEEEGSGEEASGDESQSEAEESQPKAEENQRDAETSQTKTKSAESRNSRQDDKKEKLESVTPTIKEESSTKTVKIKRINNLKKSFSNCGERPYYAEKQEKKEAKTEGKFADRLNKDRKKRHEGPLFRVVQGEVSVKDSWPWMAGLFRKINESEEFFCGASLISTRFLLTAAHCFDHVEGVLDPGSYRVSIGHNKRDEGDFYDVEQVIFHPGYKRPMFYHDIVLIKVKDEVELSDSVTPICLPSYNLDEIELMPEEDFLTFAGWGIKRENDHEAAELLEEVTVPVYSHSKCNESYQVMETSFPHGLTDSFICAGLQEGGKDTCKGDSGGPLIVEVKDKTWLQLGVLSSGYGCARAGFPGLYTKTAHYLDWIYYNTDLLGGIYEIKKDFVCSE